MTEVSITVAMVEDTNLWTCAVDVAVPGNPPWLATKADFYDPPSAVRWAAKQTAKAMEDAV